MGVASPTVSRLNLGNRGGRVGGGAAKLDGADDSISNDSADGIGITPYGGGGGPPAAMGANAGDGAIGPPTPYSADTSGLTDSQTLV